MQRPAPWPWCRQRQCAGVSATAASSASTITARYGCIEAGEHPDDRPLADAHARSAVADGDHQHPEQQPVRAQRRMPMRISSVGISTKKAAPQA